MHSHSFYQILLIFSGEMKAEAGTEALTAGPGDIVFYDREIPHREWNCAGIPLEMIYLDWEGPAPGLPRLIKDYRGRARIMAEWLLGDFKTSLSLDTDDSVDAMIEALLLETRRNAFPHEDNFVHKVQSSIVDNITQSITLDFLAEIFSMNKFTFLRKYKKLTGRTPMDEVRRIRVEKARDMIISTDIPLKEIAEKCGLSNEQHLSRVFSRHLKVPPGYFRKSL